MSAQLFKKLRKPGSAPTLIAGMLSNIMVFAEPVSRVTTHFLLETPVVAHRSFSSPMMAVEEPESVSGVAQTGTTEAPSLPAPVAVATASKKDSEAPLSPTVYSPMEEQWVYYASEPQGAIGISEGNRSDNGRDNYFTIVLPDSLALESYTPVLAYTLHGLSDALSTTKSVNGSAAYGGEQRTKDDDWKEVEEYLPVSLLKLGKNEIFFTRRTDAEYGYHIKDVSLKLYPATSKAPQAYRQAVETAFRLDSSLESKIFSFRTPDEDPTSFYALQLAPIAAEDFDKIPEAKVRALPFKDIKPLGQDLVNVTAGSYKSFRVSFSKPATTSLRLHLKYEPDEIPEGYSSKDIRTFVYDKNNRRWKALPVETVDRETSSVTSLINDPGGETDYINGILKAPEHPETAGFAPTSLTDIEFANPAAGVVSIAPPSPNNTGAVATSFPIKLPPGRNGLQPSLEVVYNSDGGNGWMGMGWDISIPAITLNTKWGVPVFDGAYESELYSLNGQDLVLKVGNDYTAPHRDDGIVRADNRIFYLRKEGSYLKVVRRGDSPKNYRWEVTDKYGNKSSYGSTVNSRVLDDDGNIVHWSLTRQEDPYGNMILYAYDKGTFSLGGGVDVQEIYISHVGYSMHTTSMNSYEVEFIRNVNPGRKDIITSARNGVFQGTRDLLQEIVVRFHEDGEAPKKIRSYRFEYKEGSFKKQLLTHIAEYDTEDELFYSNTIDYYDEVGSGGTIINNNPQTWEGGNDPFSSTLSGFAPPGLKHLVPEGSALGASESSGYSIGFRAGVGIGTNPSKVTSTLGGSFSYKESTLNTKVSLLDINGDGLPDKVFSHGGTVYYRPNTGNGFGNPITIGGLSRIGETESWTRGTGFDANVGIAGFGLGIGTGDSRTRSATDHYFVDFNGDGLPDMVSNNRVRFNTTQANSDPLVREFDMAGIGATENPIVSGNIDPAIIPHLELETIEEIRERYPQFDHVRVWRAPYDGNISITGQAQLIQQPGCGNTDPNLNGNNYFRLTVEHAAYNSNNGEYAQTSQQGAAVTLTNSTNTPNINRTITDVEKGDLFFFRVHNLQNGCGGEVKWNPAIEYTSFDTGVGINTGDRDEHGVLFRQYGSEQDFMINNGGDWIPNPDITNVFIDYNLLEADFETYQFSDDIEFVIQRVESDISNDQVSITDTWTRTYNHQGIGGGQNVFSGNGTMNAAMAPSGNYLYSLRFYVRSTSNVAWDEINWKPVITSNGQTYYPPVSYLTYEENVYQQPYWVAANNLPNMAATIPAGEENDSLVKVHHNLYSKPTTISNPTILNAYLDEINSNGGLPIQIHWVIKEEVSGVARVAYKKTFYFIKDGSNYVFSQVPNTYVAPGATDNEFIFTKQQIKDIWDSNGRIYSAFYVDSREVGVFNLTEIQVNTIPSEQSGYPMQLQNIERSFIAMNPAFFGSSYRGWGQFLYNGGILLNRDSDGELTGGIQANYATSPIDIGEVNVDPDEVENDVNYVDSTNPNTVNGSPSDANRFVFYTQDNENERYTSPVITGAVYGGGSGLTAHLGRFARENLFDVYVSYADLVDGPSNTFIGIKQRSKSNGSSVTAQGNSPFGGIGGTDSEGRSKVLNQYIDLNGDRYPDLVTEGLVQFTGMTGGLVDKTVNPNFSSGDRSEDFTEGVTIMPPTSTGGDNGRILGNKTNTNAQSGLNEGIGSSYAARQWVDINGDGLPDQVRISETDIKVRLNTGYGFTANEIVWANGFSGLKTNTRSNEGIGASEGLGGSTGGSTSASFAVGFGVAESTANSNATLLDVNGDGLPDLVVKDGNNYNYYLNTGTGFESNSSTFYQGAIEIEEDVSVAGNLFGTVTFGFTLSIIPVKFTFTPTLGGDASVSEKTATVQDIDGDGLPDVLSKQGDNASVKARLNRVGKTHLLKKVNTPLGGSWEVDYARTGNTYEMPQNKWVMRTLTTHDGFAGDDDFDEADNETLTTFTYEEGHHNRREREFFGFEKVTTEQRNPTNNNRYRYTVKSYHNKNYYLKGALKETTAYTDGGDILSRTRHFYNLQRPDVAFTSEVNVPLDAPYIHPNVVADMDRTRAFPALIKTISTTYEDTQALHLVQEFRAYDGYGNITTHVNQGGGANDAYRTEIAYGNLSFRGLPTDIKVFDGNGTTALRHREALYNNQGKLERITTHLGAGNTHRVELKYDAYGNVIEINQLDNLDESGTTHFVQEIAYDNILHTYPVAFGDSYGQSSTAVYDYLFGVPVLVTDMNNNSMRTRIDNRGRVIEIAGPNEYNPNASNGDDWIIRKQYKGEQDVENQIGNPGPNDYRFNNAQGSFEAVPHTAPANPTNSQHHAVTRHKDPLSTTNNEFLTVSIVDGFGQAIQLKKKHVADGNEVWQVSGKETKDAFGRVIESYLPTVQAYNPSNFSYDDNTPGSSLPPVVMDYDHRNRQTMIQQPNEQNHTAISYAIENQMLVTKVVNELGQTQDTYTDNRGRQRKVVQNSEITTEFHYNCIDEQVRVKNQAGYETKYFYDMAGRRVKEQHPDRGATHYTYDNGGRLVQKQTANLMQPGNTGQIQYNYHYHRLLEIDYPQFPQNKVTYEYGDGSQGNQTGRLTVQKDATGIQLFGYNRLGQITEQRRSMAVAGKKSYWFSTYWAYDSWNRVSQITYPDEEVVSYNYDTAGQLQSITSDTPGITTADIITDITYTDYGEREQITYGNSTVTNYDYDSRRRLEELSQQFSGIQVDKVYAYDELSNITGIVTGVSPGGPAFGSLAGPAAHAYEYDDYNRLVSATGYYVGPDDAAPDLLKQAYSLEMAYDLSHNILSKTQTHQYGTVASPGASLPQNAPHAATSYGLVYEDYAGAALDAGGYGYAQPHAPRTIVEYPPDYADDPDDPRVKRKMIDYDANGNQTEVREQVNDPEQPLGYREVKLRENLWDEEDRLRAVDLNPEADPDKPEIAVYTYDAGGERSIRYLPGRFDAYYSAKEAGKNHRLEAILYPSSLLTVTTLPLEDDEQERTPGLMHEERPLDFDLLERIAITKYTKHYYIGSERVSSALGSIRNLGILCESIGAPGWMITEMNSRVSQATQLVKNDHLALGKTVSLPAEGHYPIDRFLRCPKEHKQEMYQPYWYHPDHVGSSSFISNLDGEINQHMEYLPFGETLVDEHLNSYNSPFKFNAKELDPETGNYYYGARYYSQKYNLMLSVDPMYELYPSFSPYAYTLQNPVRYVDPTGMYVEESDDWVLGEDGKYVWDENVTSPDDPDLNGREYVGKNLQDVESHFEENNNWLNRTFGSKKGGYLSHTDINSYYDAKIPPAVQDMFSKHKWFNSLKNNGDNRADGGYSAIVRNNSIKRILKGHLQSTTGVLCLDGVEYNYTAYLSASRNTSLNTMGYHDEHPLKKWTLNVMHGGQIKDNLFYLSNGATGVNVPVISIEFDNKGTYESVRAWYEKYNQ